MSTNERCETDVLLPLANPATSRLLISLVNRLSSEEEKKAVLLSFVPDRGKEKDASRLLDEEADCLNSNFSVNKQVLIDRNPARGILRAAKKFKAKLLVVGWHSPDEKNSRKGRVLDPVLKKSPCSVLIGKSLEKMAGHTPRQILVPLTGVKDSDVLSVKTAESMLDPAQGGRITILYFNRSPIRLNHINYLLTQVITRNNVKLDGIASDSEKPVKTAILQAREFDLVTIGVIEPWLFRRGKPSFSERIALETPGAMLMVRTPRPVRSKINFFT